MKYTVNQEKLKNKESIFTALTYSNGETSACCLTISHLLEGGKS